MKKYVLTLGILVIASTLFAQQHTILFQNNSSLSNEQNGKIAKDDFVYGKQEKTGLRLFSKQDEDIKLDSLVWDILDENTGVWELTGKWIYEYDASGNRSKRIDFVYNLISAVWEFDHKQETTYDSNGNRSDESYDWDKTEEKWIGTYKSENNYDENGNNTSSTSYDWNNDQWVESFKREFHYDGSNRLTEENNYQWKNSSWIDTYWYEYFYNELNLRTSYIRYKWDANLENFTFLYKHEYSYDENGNNTLYRVFSWDEQSSLWLDESKEEYEYDAEGNKIGSTRFTWDQSIEEWTNYSKSSSSFVKSKIVFHESHTWDNSSSMWIGSLKYTREYDENNNLIGYEYYYGWNENSEWIGDEKIDFVRNDLGNSSSYSLYSWNSELLEWYVMDKGIYYYSDHNLILGDLDSRVPQKITVFPNPTQSVFQLKNQHIIQSIQVFDLNGRLQKEFDGFQNTYSIQDLHSGIYSVLVRTLEGTEKFRIVKK